MVVQRPRAARQVHVIADEVDVRARFDEQRLLGSRRSRWGELDVVRGPDARAPVRRPRAVEDEAPHPHVGGAVELEARGDDRACPVSGSSVIGFFDVPRGAEITRSGYVPGLSVTRWPGAAREKARAIVRGAVAVPGAESEPFGATHSRVPVDCASGFDGNPPPPRPAPTRRGSPPRGTAVRTASRDCPHA